MADQRPPRTVPPTGIDPETTFDDILDIGQPAAEPGASPYLDDIGRSIVECVTSLEETSTLLTETARVFSAQAAAFSDHVARLRGVAGLLAPHPSEQ